MSHKRGSGVSITDEIAERIFERLADGETLKAICREEDMPSRRTVYNRRDSDPEFAERLNQAYCDRWEGWADDIIDVSRDGGTDRLPDGSISLEHVAQRRLFADNLKWRLGKEDSRYSARIAHSVTGLNGGPMVHTITEGMSIKEAAAAYEAMLDGGSE